MIETMKNTTFFISLLLMLSICVFVGCGTSKEKKSVDTALENPSSTKLPNAADKIYAKPQVPILCYHRIEDGRHDEYSVSVSAFAEQMKLLADSGYHTVSPRELYDYLVFNDTLPSRPIMLTFDDARVEQATVAAPEMEKYGFRGVFFIMTITYNKKNYMSKDQIKLLSERGHTIGFHSWDHTRATHYTNDSILRVNVVNPKKELESIVGAPVDYFAYPYGLTDSSTCRLMEHYFKLSFILSTPQDSVYPLQTVRRMIVPSSWSAPGVLRAMQRTFTRKN